MSGHPFANPVHSSSHGQVDYVEYEIRDAPAESSMNPYETMRSFMPKMSESDESLSGWELSQRAIRREEQMAQVAQEAQLDSWKTFFRRIRRRARRGLNALLAIFDRRR